MVVQVEVTFVVAEIVTLAWIFNPDIHVSAPPANSRLARPPRFV
jgi:hypothetical protein